MTSTSGDAADDGNVVEIRLEPDLRAPYLARRLVGSLVTTGSRPRAIDASLLAGEITTVALAHSKKIVLGVKESGRTLRVSVTAGDGHPGQPDAIAGSLLDRVADRWSSEGSLWFEIDLIRRQDLTGLSDKDLFALLPRDREARDELFDRYARFAASISRRFSSRDHRADDIEQVAMLGLVRSLERFDPAQGVKFTSFAAPWIAGTVKHHLRDHGWSMRVPRSLQEQSLTIRRTRAELTQHLGRDPTVDELADATGLTGDEIRAATLAGDTYTLASLDAPAGANDEHRLGDLLGGVDPEFALAEEWPLIEEVLDRLSDREQQILYLRFFEDLTQAEIASIVGISQVHVSRVLSKSLERVRSLLQDQVDD